MARATLIPLALCALAIRQVAGAYTQPFPGEDPCPATCDLAGSNPSNWTVYSDLARLDACDRTMLLDFAVYTPLDDTSKQTTLRACTAASATLAARTPSLNSTDAADTNQTSLTSSVQLISWSSGTTVDISNVLDGASQARAFLGNHAGASLLFAARGSDAVGVFIGALVKDAVLNSKAVPDFLDSIKASPVSQSLAQVCGGDRGADYTFGIVAAAGVKRMATVQRAVAAWVNGTCVEANGGSVSSLGELSTPPPPTPVSKRGPSRVDRRALCATTTVASGDSCSTLSKKCGVSLAQFQSNNPGSGFCTGLQPGQIVCCSSGSLPTPTPNADGTCASYVVQAQEWCSTIAGKNAVTVNDIESWNKNTWGWTGCDNLQAGVNMCLSKGNPPMPAPMANALCGPQVPGTKQPTDGTKLADLNMCPLNACCDIWGQCGTTSEFCTPSGNGAPGTADPGQNGCISNCGTDIVKGSAPSSLIKVGYFEGWNPSRPCLKMDIGQVDSSAYTHLHFGFAGLKSDTFEVNIGSDIEGQFKNFVKLKTSMKKILSIGGWTFSTAPFDFQIFRDAFNPTNRANTAGAIAQFVVDNGLDGIDIDWEYPGAPDIPGIPPGSPDDAAHYLTFLTTLRSKLPKDKSLSIAAPASFWYLKAFPIKRIGSLVDYIVYMTYDLHGQWDYGSKWSSPGCEKGNCLRSHVNLTETMTALSMITKAGVPSNKIVVGVSSYGRSFKMTDASCAGPMCTYTGPDSGAQKGPCTDTAGYISNAEINNLKQVSNSGLLSYYDEDSDSDIMVYNTDQWVAYMSDTTKKRRTDTYLGYNFAGTSDWAIDLQRAYASPNPGPPSSGNSSSQPDLNAYGHIDPTIQYCSDERAKVLRQAWVDASTLAKLHVQWSPKGKWQNVMDLYMGKGSRNDWRSSPNNDYGPIQSNIVNEYKIHFATNGIDGPFWTYAWFYCGDDKIGWPEDKQLCKGSDAPIAYSWDSPGWFWSAHYIVFCDSFFTTGIALADMVKKADGDSSKQRKLSEWYDVQANTVLHETYHWERTVSNPRCMDYAYPAQDVADLAYYQEDKSRINAESFADCAISIYIMDKWGLSDPPTPNGGPYQPGSPPGAVAANRRDALESPPTGWTSPVDINAATYQWNSSLQDVVLMSSLGDPQDDSSRSMECLDGDSFITKEQCEIFCPFSTCESSKDSDGITWYKCTGCPTGGKSCVNRDYEDMRQCNLGCNGGSCSRKDGYAAVTCTGCGPHVCKNGMYDDFDKCGDSCFMGYCQEAAGIKGIKCVCPE